MKFVKKHINAIVAIGVLVLIVVGLLLLKSIFFPNESKAIYGTRLDGRNKVEITSDKKNDIKEELSASAPTVEVRVAGRIVYIIAKVNGDVSLEAAKELGNKVLEKFSDKEKEYYDIQILIENDTNTSQFPIIGYKHHTKEAIAWTKDRAES